MLCYFFKPQTADVVAIWVATLFRKKRKESKEEQCTETAQGDAQVEDIDIDEEKQRRKRKSTFVLKSLSLSHSIHSF